MKRFLIFTVIKIITLTLILNYDSAKAECKTIIDTVAFKGCENKSQLLKLYQTIISKQDGKRCVFELTCSEYASYSFRNYYFLEAILMTFDRLLRCHPGAVDYYESGKTGFLIDPPVFHNFSKDFPLWTLIED